MIADSSTAEAVAERLKTATSNLHRMANDVGTARQLREFIVDSKKNLLAKYMLGPIKSDESAAAAEVIARANPDYLEDLKRLGEQYEEAERVISRWTATQASYEAARSLLSFQKETMRELS